MWTDPAPRARCKTLVLAALLALPVATLAAPAVDNGCKLQAPVPVLSPHAYPDQHNSRGKENSLLESAVLAKGVRLEIRHSSCVDGVAMELVLVAPGRLADDQAAIALLRATIGKLKWDRERAGAASLIAFLDQAAGLPLRKGARSVCNDGSLADPGECSWESNGGFVLRVERRQAMTRISVTATISA